MFVVRQGWVVSLPEKAGFVPPFGVSCYLLLEFLEDEILVADWMVL